MDCVRAFLSAAYFSTSASVNWVVSLLCCGSCLQSSLLLISPTPVSYSDKPRDTEQCLLWRGAMINKSQFCSVELSQIYTQGILSFLASHACSSCRWSQRINHRYSFTALWMNGGCICAGSFFSWPHSIVFLLAQVQVHTLTQLFPVTKHVNGHFL